MKASIATLAFILSSAAKFSVKEGTLSSELQQLGLPKGTPVSSITTFIHLSLYDGAVPRDFDQDLANPIIMKDTMQNYCVISNLSFIKKILKNGC